MHGQDDNLRFWVAAFYFFHAFQTAHFGHRQVQQQQIRLPLAEKSEGFLSVRCLANHFEFGIPLQQQFQAGAKQLMIIRQ